LEEPETAKRYVLFASNAELTPADTKALSELLEGKYGKVRLIAVEGNPLVVIVKTTDDVVPLLREPGNTLKVGGKELSAVLTSGAVGKLKRKGAKAGAHGEVPQ